MNSDFQKGFEVGFETGYDAGVQAAILAITNHAFSKNQSLALIESLNLPAKVSHRLRVSGIRTVGALTRLSPEQILSIRNIGALGLQAIVDKLSSLGLNLAPETSVPFNPAT